MIHTVARVLDPYSEKYEAPLTVGMYVHAEIIGKKVDDGTRTGSTAGRGLRAQSLMAPFMCSRLAAGKDAYRMRVPILSFHMKL